jgi:membrane protein
MPPPVTAEPAASPAAESRADEAPPARRLGARGWWRVLRATVRGFRAKELTDRAAALTYYGLLSLLPALVALVALLGVVGRQSTVDSLLEIVGDVGSEGAVDAVREPLQQVVAGRGAGALLGLALVGALWSASGYIGAFGRAGNAIWEVREGRPIWKWRPLQVLVTLVMVLLLAATLVGLVVTGPVATAVGEELGVADAATTAWEIAKWPVMLLIVMVAVAFLYRVAPDVRRPFRWLSPGAALAIVVWIVASALLGLYVASFGAYDETYGSLGGVIVLLLWMWITNCALLFGLQLDAEFCRAAEGRDQGAEPQASDETGPSSPREETAETT